MGRHQAVLKPVHRQGGQISAGPPSSLLHQSLLVNLLQQPVAAAQSRDCLPLPHAPPLSSSVLRPLCHARPQPVAAQQELPKLHYISSSNSRPHPVTAAGRPPQASLQTGCWALLKDSKLAHSCRRKAKAGLLCPMPCSVILWCSL